MSEAVSTIPPEPVTLRAADGYPVAALRYPAVGEVEGHLVIGGAAGVPQRFYRRFAMFAAGRGLTTLTLDYGGVGGSKPPSLKGFEATFLDWADLDLAAAVDAMVGDGVPLHFVGHSFGGHAFGLLPKRREDQQSAPLRDGHGVARLDAAARTPAGAGDVEPRRPCHHALERLPRLEHARHGRGPATGRVPALAPMVPSPTVLLR